MHDDPADVLVIGGGPAGLTAGLYAARSRLNTVLLEKGITGGQAFTTSAIENFPGFPDGISGPELTARMRTQAERFGLTIKTGTVVESLSCRDGLSIVSNTETFNPKTVIVASGADPRRLEIPGEAKFTGRGVSYCATCDGAFFTDKSIAVIGGGDAAVEEAIFLTRFAAKVFLVHRRDQLRAAKVIQERAFTNSKIDLVWNTIPLEILGDQTVAALKVKDVKTESVSELDVSGVFIYVGTSPNTGFLPAEVDTDDNGFIFTDDRMATSVPGIFAAGDVRRNTLKQIVVATGEGAIAAVAAEHYIETANL